ncbi:MAG: alkaline phosphatase family protein [Nevskia sp.]|nr:alkaline phosphatase family protein [Nevskia sp.]
MDIGQLRGAVRTVIIVIMENRSFDHVLGHLSQDGSRPEVDGIGPDLLLPAYLNPAGGQGYRPFQIAQDGWLDQDLPHDLASVAKQLAFEQAAQRYAMNGFAQAYLDQGGSRTVDLPPLGFMPRSCVPVSSWFADNFAICDRWFCSLPSSTHPNKLMALAGKSTVDDTGTLIPDQDTLLDWLDTRGIDWRVYHDGFFSFFALMSRYWPWFAGDRFRRFDTLQGDLANPSATAPQVILVEPAYGDSPGERHPNDNHPPLPIGFGEDFLLRVYQALCSAPAAVSSKTVLIVLSDEHGGFWDHVPPHPTPGYTSVTGTRFNTTGPRVPAFVISPLVSPRRVVHDMVFDHTSILQFLAECFAPGGGGYSHEVDARAAFGFNSVSKVLDLAAPRPLPPPPDIALTVPTLLQLNRPIVTAGQRAFAHAIDGVLASQYRQAILAKLPQLHAWDLS